MGLMTIANAAWRDLIGVSDRWVRTVLYALLIGRLSKIAIAILFFLTIGEVSGEGFSGKIERLDLDFLVKALIFAPVFESLAIAGLVFLMGHKAGWGWPVWATALVCGVLAIPFHGLSALSLLVAIPFAIMAAIQHNWMAKGRGWVGLCLIILIHLLGNAVSVGVWALVR
ncbi:MAG: hypothetical protein ACOVMT_04585 [Caulobacter sp.]